MICVGNCEGNIVILRFISLFLLVFVLSGCAHEDGGGFSLSALNPSATMRSFTRPERPFADAAARGYRLLAEYETWRDDDPEAAAVFRNKAERADAGDVPPPEMPDPAQFSAADLEDMAKGRRMLIDAQSLLAERDEAASVMLAEALVNYDCWLERASEGAEAAQWCRERLFRALDGLQIQDAHEYMVNFKPDNSVPDGAGLATVRAAATAFDRRPGWHIHIIGHGDGGRNKEKAALLGMRRAMAVRNALAQHGVDFDHISMGATADKGSRRKSAAAAARKECQGCVEVTLLPADMDHPDDGPDIRKIAPHYFGSAGQDW